MAESQKETRLLLVDDERDFLHAVEPGLERRGFAVTLAESGVAALDLLSSQDFDVIVLDVKMPGIDGVDTFRKIKGSLPEIPVIILTGHASIEQAFQTSREGIYDYLTKPCNVEELARVAREAVELTRARREADGTTITDEIRVLLVDDDRDFVRTLAAGLERRGLMVRSAHDGHEAIRSAREAESDVAVVDLVMPELGGLTLLDRLREVDPLLEVIILTGYPSIESTRRALKDGAFDFLTKPQRVEDLLGHIRAAWERRQRRQEEERRREAERVLSERPE